ncbi:hypothetical protein V4C53_35115 [Paraburkholderia azotifigens]|uniref:hypothetical protein n=1 Tax=Paraburkholderia azotifigens TaxID=2057004 RepID=UPI003176AD1D
MPLTHFEFNTALSRQQVQGRLALITSMERSCGSLSNGSPATFIGKVGDNSFKLRRNIKYRNSFLPTIYGVFVGDTAETRVKVYMYLHPFVVLFLAVWFGTLGIAIAKLVAKHEFVLSGPAALPIAMCIFAIALTTAGFLPEARIAKRIIMTTLKAK